MTILRLILWTMLTAHCHKEPAVIPQLFCCVPSGINSRILSVKSAVCVDFQFPQWVHSGMLVPFFEPFQFKCVLFRFKELALPLKFIYSEKATNFCKISSIDLSYVVKVKSTVEISQNFVAFSEYMNFKDTDGP